MTFHQFANHLRRFRNEERGSVTIEAVLMFPTLFCACLATYVFFELSRAQSVSLKAAYTISDVISRRGEDYVTNGYLTSIWRLHRFITNSPERTGLRVSVITYDAADDSYAVCWSKNKGGAGNLNQAALDALVADNRIPVVPDGEEMILVQTWTWHAPIFSIGRDWTREFQELVVTSPRFAAQVKWSSDGTEANVNDCY